MQDVIFYPRLKLFEVETFFCNVITNNTKENDNKCSGINDKF